MAGLLQNEDNASIRKRAMPVACDLAACDGVWVF
jgi:hypothetical protein